MPKKAINPAPKRRGMFLGDRKDGLGARLLLILNCIRGSRLFDAEFRVCWRTTDGFAPNLYHPEEIFSKAFMEDHFLPSGEFDALASKSTPLWKFMGDKNADNLIAHLEQGLDILVDEGFEVMVFPWEDIEEERKTYRQYFSGIGLTDNVKTSCEMLDNTIDGSGGESLAYHLRRGDILNVAPWKHKTWLAKIEPDSYYERHIEKNPDAVALIFSDTPAAVDRLKKKFPNLFHLSDLINLSEFTNIQRDFLELYAMSRADKIIAPTISAFSSAAARISGRQRLRFHEVLDQEDVVAARKQSIDLLSDQLDSFLSPSEAAHVYSCVERYATSDEERKKTAEIIEKIQKAGADNAFLDLLQAVNYVYLKDWHKAIGFAQKAQANPNLWPEDFSAAKALQSAAHSALGMRFVAGSMFRQAYLFKPLRSDVLIFGTYLLQRFHLNRNNFLPCEPHVLRQVRLGVTEDLGNSYVLGQHLNGRRRCELRIVTLDWHQLVLDGKSARLPTNQAELRKLDERIELSNPEKLPRDSAPYLSTVGQLRAYRKMFREAYQMSEAAVKLDPENPLYHKRLATVRLCGNDKAGCEKALRHANELAPDNAFYLYALGRFLADHGDAASALRYYEKATHLVDDTSSLWAEYGMLLYKEGKTGVAKVAMEKAQNLTPVFKKFQNQLARISR